MMKSDILISITDVIYLFLLRIKLILKDYITVAVLIVSAVIFTLIIRSMTLSAQDFSSLPIGIVDNDNSSSSKELILGLKDVEALRIIEKSERELNELLFDEMIHSIFVIEEGYEEKLKAGDLSEIITMHYKKDNRSSSILSDIIAGEIIYPASLYKGMKHYEKIQFNGNKLTASEYKDYIDQLLENSNDFDFAFHMIYANPKEATVTEEPISNSVLYNQFIFGILGILISFMAMFIMSQTVREKEMGVDVRLKISRFYILKRDTGNLGALLLLEGLLAVLFTSLIYNQLQVNDIKLWLSAYLLLILNAFVLGGVLLLLTKAIKRMLIYQVFCSILILLTGGLGFYHLLSGFYKGVVDKIINIIPNSWFIMGFTDIIIYKSEGGYLKKGHQMLLVMALVLIIFIVVVDLLQGFHKNKVLKEQDGKYYGQED